jgi:hypothetical protein
MSDDPGRFVGNLVIDEKTLMELLGFPGARLRCICQQEMAEYEGQVII